MRILFTAYLALIIGIFGANAQSCAASYVQRIKSATSRYAALSTAEQAEQYLYTPGSEGYDEELFIEVLRALIESPLLTPEDKIRPTMQLEAAEKNRPGTEAADITYKTIDGSIHSLSQATSQYTLLLFYDPDCDECADIKRRIESEPIFAEMAASNALSIIAIYPYDNEQLWRQSAKPGLITYGFDSEQQVLLDETYLLPQIPTLYLLRGMTIALKNTDLDAIIRSLQK